MGVRIAIPEACIRFLAQVLVRNAVCSYRWSLFLLSRVTEEANLFLYKTLDRFWASFYRGAGYAGGLAAG